ncbi:DUF3987 domain-containing protein [Dactylosporangium sp. CA-233914]|uniref:DUF3987 domain-containing protein n=1 Tax=Dactylosporangium sp. CA-233914 TaxID=3239934 RepID=UPI003D8C3CD6
MTAPRLHLITGDAPPPELSPALWDVPVPLGGRAAPPPFPVDVYPGWLAAMVSGIAEFTQTDTAMAGTVALAVLSACAGGRLDVEAKPGWREPVNVAVIAEPGERKSPVHGALTRPLFAAQQTLAEKARPRIEQAATLNTPTRCLALPRSSWRDCTVRMCEDALVMLAAFGLLIVDRSVAPPRPESPCRACRQAATSRTSTISPSTPSVEHSDTGSFNS